jgi:hypothetical protein
MVQSQSILLSLLMVAWGVVTAVLLVLVIYRGTLSVREDDQIYINPSEVHRYEEQQAMVAKITRLRRPIIGLAVVSGVLLLSSAGVWIYQGFMNQ